MSARLLIGVWASLLALLALTVGASFVLAGPASLAAGIVVALLKAGLIFWFYMHLREETGVVRLVAIAAGAWLFILFALSFTDYATRGLLATP